MKIPFTESPLIISFVFICSITGGIGIPGVNTSVELPSASVTGAALPTTSLIQPTIPAIGTVPGIQIPGTQSADIGSPTEFLLLKNMFDPAVEVFIYLCFSLSLCSFNLDGHFTFLYCMIQNVICFSFSSSIVYVRI